MIASRARLGETPPFPFLDFSFCTYFITDLTFLIIWILLQLIGQGSVPHDLVFRLQRALELALS